MFELANEENIRLRNQLQAERNEYHESIKHKTEALTFVRRENKYLRSALSRIQMLSNTNAAYNQEKRRRQSTGEITMLFPPRDTNSSSYEEPSMTLSNRAFHGSVALSYERKIKILLDEIEGMQADEEIMYMKRNKLVTKNAMLEQQLLSREESVKQLEHDLRIMQLQCQ
ncbi:hypothetical protein BDA99DRAFT_522852 [Phascolomyces articulosus]|uniref:Uncharacterized protein n=1 Tax=Phascolomyces articulosus TaxID=60185 RepID=A0AAD5JR95_9FUNG|nr:hypothetical protein BDA99DRAFT_522852 [Phascolomyces articulosus]